MDILAWIANLCDRSNFVGSKQDIQTQARPQALEFGKKKEDSEGQVSEVMAELPEELIVKIFENLSIDASKYSVNSKALQPFLQCAQVSRQWRRISEGYFSNIWEQLMGKDKPENLSWAQSLGLLYNWSNQTEKGTFLLTSQPSAGEFKPIDYHLALDNSVIVFDKVEMNGVRVLLGEKCLLGVTVEMTKDGRQVSKRLWNQPIEKAEHRLFVSTDQKLIATQHYYEVKSPQSQLGCRFDVRHLPTGRLLGRVDILCPEREKIFKPANIQFDLTKFIYQKEEKLWTRYYDPSLVSLKLEIASL